MAPFNKQTKKTLVNQKQKASGDSSTKKFTPMSDDDIMEKYGDYLWKADRVKLMRAYVLCKPCMDYNKENYAPELVDGRLVKTEAMCMQCLKVNADFNTACYFLTKNNE